jgi:lipoprotein-releasing system permease protein
MPLSFFISKRFVFSGKNSSFINLISVIAAIGIALGVATLILALSILQGFEKSITDKIIDFDSHIQITSYTDILPDYHNNIRVITSLLPEGTAINPYTANLAIISSRTIQEGISIKGIFPDNNALNIRENIVEGEFLLNTPERNYIIIGRKLADKLLVKVGERLSVFALSDNKIPSPDNPPNIKQYYISAIFESGMAEYDDLNAYVDIYSAQELFGFGDNITGYDIKLNSVENINYLAQQLNSNLRYPHSVKTIYEIHRNIFTWIELQKEPIPIVLGLIIIVAVFNIISTLLMIVLEKTNAIGTLKAIGASNRTIVGIFIFQGLFLAVLGIVLGNSLSLLLIYFQQRYDIISLPSSVYFMSSVPFSLSPWIFAGVSLLTLVLCLVVSIIPSYIATRISPVKALRFG